MKLSSNFVIFDFFLISVLSTSVVSFSVTKYEYVQTEQIHLSYTGDPTSMFVTWTTSVYVGEGSVSYTAVDSNDTSTHVVNATMTSMRHYSDDDNTTFRTTYTFRATMTDLIPDTFYEYSVQNILITSDQFQFRTFPPQNSSDFKPTIAVFGDMGVENHVALDKLKQDGQKRAYDIIWHLGDIAYNMHELMGARGDAFMRLIQPIAAHYPYSVIPGNHERTNNFSEYRNKFTSPPPSVFYHSYNIGPIHLIMFTTEFYIYDEYGTGQLQAQYNWLVEDLEKANTPEARQNQPWIITTGHRPMYCSAKDNEDCDADNPIRTGYKNEYYKLEDLFYQNGVDIQLYGHKHNYERMYPMYNYDWERVQNSSLYLDPKYPVHVITGAAGNREIHPQLKYPEPEWSFMRKSEYGLAYLKVLDRLTLEISQYSIDAGKNIDQFIVKKSQNYPNFGPAL